MCCNFFQVNSKLRVLPEGFCVFALYNHSSLLLISMIKIILLCIASLNTWGLSRSLWLCLFYGLAPMKTFWFWWRKCEKLYFFSRYLYISIVFFSCVICAAEFWLSIIIQKFLNRCCIRGHDCQKNLPQWLAHLHAAWAAFRYSWSCKELKCNIYLKQIGLLKINIPKP